MVFGTVTDKFAAEAKNLDYTMTHIIPHYDEMLTQLVEILPFSPTDEISVIDLGCGTGTIGQKILKKYPKAKLTCIDFSEAMLAMAKQKIGENAIYQQADFHQFDFSQPYHAIVSSLALHHLKTNQDKQNFYHKIYQALLPGGVYLNAENVKSEATHLHEADIAAWKKFMQKTYSDEEIEKKWLAGYYEDDYPISLAQHFQMMQQANFSIIDAPYKYHNFALLYGQKVEKNQEIKEK